MWDVEHSGYRDKAGQSRIQNDLEACRSTSLVPRSNHEATAMRDATTITNPVRVAVVGAGFAGLRCADVLLRHGCTVAIFEARERLGGRVAQSKHLGHLVDLGPNWIHGTKDNPMMQLAKETNTELHAWDEDEAIIGSDGNVLTADEAEEYSALLWDDGLIADAFRHSNEKCDQIKSEESLYDFFVDRASRLFCDEPADVASRKRETLLLVSRMWGAYIGSPVMRQSLKYFWLEECVSGENPFVAGTYGRILKAIAAHAQQNADIRLGAAVVKICSNEAAGKDPMGHGKVTVVTAKDAPEPFDEVVVTVPLGCLKRNDIMFEPPLAPPLSNAINNIGYGSLDKVYITFPAAFWEPASDANAQTGQPRSQGPLDPHGTTPNVAASTMPLHQPPKGEAKEKAHYPGFTHWLSPTYALDTNPDGWDPQAMNLAAMPPNCAHPTLLFYLYGPCSAHIASMVCTATSDKERDERLFQFFKPYYSRLPNFNAANNACQPKAVLATAWASDKYAGYGSYSNFQVGLERGDKDIETMRRGMPERHVWLAGEHTAPFVALGTTTGAYWAGEKVAERILRAHGLQVEQWYPFWRREGVPGVG